MCFLTGASKRLGASTARKFHAEGFNVIIHFNNSRQEAESLVAQLNALREGSAKSLQADLTDREQLNLCANRSRLLPPPRRAGQQRLVVLSNTSAGVLQEQWDDLIDSNLRAAFYLSQQLAPELTRRAGSVVNMVDTHADSPLKGFPIYSIAKAGVKAMTKSLAKELAPRVRVNGVSPGAILWPPSLEDESKPEVF